MVYEPKIAIHPGRHIARLLDELGVNQSWLSERAGVSKKLISQVINGEALISPDLAVSLENVFGVSAEFWSNLNSNYLTAKSKIDRVEKALATGIRAGNPRELVSQSRHPEGHRPQRAPQ